MLTSVKWACWQEFIKLLLNHAKPKLQIPSLFHQSGNSSHSGYPGLLELQKLQGRETTTNKRGAGKSGQCGGFLLH